MSPFDKAMDFVFRWEGGYVNHPNDPGGETNFGISKRAYPEVDIRNLTQWQAKEIYYADYWVKIQGDELGRYTAIVTMDYAVNSGVSRASKALQRAVGATPDGIVGPITVRAFEATEDLDTALLVIKDRVNHLCDLAKSQVKYTAFLNGWMNRTHSLVAFLGEIK